MNHRRSRLFGRDEEDFFTFNLCYFKCLTCVMPAAA
jgi:hypothetical protein